MMRPVLVILADGAGQAAVSAPIGEPTKAPELDLLGTAGLEVDGTFTGSAAHLVIDDGANFQSDATFELLDIESVSTHGSDYGFRAEFEGLSFGSEGSAAPSGVTARGSPHKAMQTDGALRRR